MVDSYQGGVEKDIPAYRENLRTFRAKSSKCQAIFNSIEENSYDTEYNGQDISKGVRS